MKGTLPEVSGAATKGMNPLVGDKANTQGSLAPTVDNAASVLAKQKHKWAVAGCIAVCFLGWGLATFIMGYVGQRASFRASLLYNTMGFLLCTLPFLPQQQFRTFTRNHLLCIVSGLMFTWADVGFFKLSSMGMSVSVLGPVTALYIIVPAVLGVLCLGETFTLRKVVGLVLAVSAICLLASDEGAA